MDLLRQGIGCWGDNGIGVHRFTDFTGGLRLPDSGYEKVEPATDGDVMGKVLNLFAQARTH